MNYLIYFNSPDKPESMGISQLTDNVAIFCSERSTILVDYVIGADIITFTKPDETEGYAVYFSVPNDFQN